MWGVKIFQPYFVQAKVRKKIKLNCWGLNILGPKCQGTVDWKCFQICLIQNLKLFFLLISIMGTMISRDRSRVLYSGVTASRLLTGLSGEPVWWEHQYHRHRHYHHHRHYRHHQFTTIANTIIIITILSRPLTMTTGDISHQNIKHLQT